MAHVSDEVASAMKAYADAVNHAQRLAQRAEEAQNAAREAANACHAAWAKSIDAGKAMADAIDKSLGLTRPFHLGGYEP
jgi:selenocysteine lyase/cysteine desulfurase